MSGEIYLAYLALVGVFFATPPDTSQLLIMSNSAAHGLRRGGFTILGDLSANILQMAAAGFGLTAMIWASADALWLVKWVGVAYLAWIGCRLFFSDSSAPLGAARPRAGRSVLYRQGFLTSAANPYAVVFFAALFPHFIDPALPVLPQILILGATYLVVDGVTLLLWGYAAERGAVWLRRLGGRLVTRVSGTLIIMAAMLLASKDFNALTGAKE